MTSLRHELGKHGCLFVYASLIPVPLTIPPSIMPGNPLLAARTHLQINFKTRSLIFFDGMTYPFGG
ncbi:hypothetical protein L208DRAFT_1410790 [Tricholoma matsutake]|nr:hypothetical protein L208DRAFT_1410790 [Tricholoma matsutake 945]